ncbi:MAG: hypothetical protein II235_07150 [Muribaculaceae bacterium]|nr:hypothetical protein [Muribaculaceae bacterium]
MKRFKKSTIIPLTLLLYLAAMSVIGFPYYQAGEYLYYLGIIGSTLLAIILLHFLLKKKEKYRKERENNINNKEESQARNSSNNKE